MEKIDDETVEEEDTWYTVGSLLFDLVRRHAGAGDEHIVFRRSFV